MNRVRAIGLAVLTIGLLSVAVDAHAGTAPTVSDGTVTSFDGTTIAYTVFEPSGASSSNQVPMILDSHGWGGSRRTTIDSTVKAFTDAGYGVLSFDQRGFGQSGGEANVQDPDFEVKDVEAVIDRIATFDWVQLDGPGDPVLGAIGGSYGGGYQTMTALAEQQATGHTRFNALAPQITWFDLNNSLAPDDVPRTEWLSVLFASGAQAVPPYIQQGFVEGVATGSYPTDIKSAFASHSPRYFTDKGTRLDIPVLFRQGISDNLFNLNQGLANFASMLTPKAQAKSRLIGFNGGHALPSVVPLGNRQNSIARDRNGAFDPSNPTAAFAEGPDACSGDGGFIADEVQFFDAVLKGKGRIPLQHPYNLTTDDGAACLRFDRLPRPTKVDVPLTVTTAGAGAPQYIALQQGPLTLAGVPELHASLTALGVDARAFVGLAVGRLPADASLVANNVLPLRAAQPVVGKHIDANLPGVAVDVKAGQTLYLVVTPNVDQFALHGSRTPGAMVLQDAAVDLPVLR